MSANLSNMPTSSVFEWPQEYNLVKPIAKLNLASEAGTRELSICQATTSDCSTLQLTDSTSVRAGDGSTHKREVVHAFDPERDPVLPLYALGSNGPGVDFNIRVLHSNGKKPVVYPFVSRADALQFQQLATGYQVKVHLEGVTCALIHRHERLPVLRRDSRRCAAGEIQLWRAGSSVDGTAPPSIRTESSSQGTQSLSPAPRSSDAITVQSDFVTGKQAVVSVHTPPPLLVALLTGDKDKYKLIKVDLTKVDTTISGNELHLAPTRSSNTFPAKQISVPDLRDWNISAMGTHFRKPGTDTLSCTFFTIKFPLPSQCTEFEGSLLDLKGESLGLVSERLMVKSNMMKNAVPRNLPGGSYDSSPRSESDGSFQSLPALGGLGEFEGQAIIEELQGSSVRFSELEARQFSYCGSNGSLAGPPRSPY